MREIIEQAERLIEKISLIFEKLKIEDKQIEIKGLEIQMNQPGFWTNQKEATKISKKTAELKEETGQWEEILNRTTNLYKLAKAAEAENDNSIRDELEKELAELEKNFATMETAALLGGKYDRENAILTIYAGAGGTDAQDWAEMLLRMYLRYTEKRDWQAAIIDRSDGTEAGIKSATIEVKGKFAYGYLKAEAGVHRLVRISPFDAERMRHTSFAMVEVLPEMEEADDFELKTDELKIDVFRASGHGGQSVNTTDSAVRIKHIPTGITVSCQNERSQLQNKETAMKILRSRVLLYQQAEREEERQKIRGELTAAAWGNQARSYVIHPYKMVKDHRSGCETQEVEKVLDGELQELIEAELKNRKTSNS